MTTDTATDMTTSKQCTAAYPLALHNGKPIPCIERGEHTEHRTYICDHEHHAVPVYWIGGETKCS